jgi:predicted transcriptional regulator
MAATEVLTLRITPALLKKLNTLSRATDRTKSRLALIERDVDRESWQVAAIEEGVRAADAGELVPHDHVAKWVESWGSTRELKRPRKR